MGRVNMVISAEEMSEVRRLISAMTESMSSPLPVLSLQSLSLIVNIPFVEPCPLMVPLPVVEE